MALRYFRCADCGHRMRVASAVCGNCDAPKELHQRLTLWVVVALGLIGICVSMIYLSLGTA